MGRTEILRSVKYFFVFLNIFFLFLVCTPSSQRILINQLNNIVQSDDGGCVLLEGESIDNRVNERDWKRALATKNAG